MERAIADLLAKGAVKEVEPQDDQFTSTLFLVQKENGDFRPVINLRALQLPSIDAAIWTDASKTGLGQLTEGYPLVATGVWKRPGTTSMSWRYEQQH